MTTHTRLLVVDIDGTLLNRNGAISAEDKAALSRVGRAGIRVALSTGRVVDACRDILELLSLDGHHMFFDGALVIDPSDGDEVYVEPISRDLVREIVRFVGEHRMDIDLYSSTRYFVERESWVTDVRRDFFGLEATVVDLDEVWQRERIIKGTLVVRSPAEKAKAASFRTHFGDRLTFSPTMTPAYPDVDFINVIYPEVSKGKALAALAGFLGIPLAEVAAIGNGDNDVSLLSAAGLSIAMGNSPDELKALADFVAPGVEESGVAAAVQRYLL